jgi:hypothetical protein
MVFFNPKPVSNIEKKPTEPIKPTKINHKDNQDNQDTIHTHEYFYNTQLNDNLIRAHNNRLLFGNIYDDVD